ncbi:MAG TPA: AAA family ATPase [Ornithinibacter sp.]|nr:AAA family ATPase [Ornithinibacter sp.]
MGLVERDRELDVLVRAFAAASAGTGSGVAVSGEPGAGKSALVEAACRTDHGLRVLRCGCDPLGTPRPLGPVRDLLADLRPLDGSSPLSEVCEVTYAVLRSEPTVVVVEDLHWVDAASVEVLRFLLRRLEAMPCAVVLTYRDDEVGEQHSVRPLLGDLAALGDVSTLRLEPLSLAGVAALVDGGPLDPAVVHSVTGGNPFFATEVAKDPDLPLPATVRDAVLARTAGIAAEDFEVLQLAASAPDRLDDRVLPSLGVDLPTLRRLHGTGLLVRERGGLVFRHELARLAVESTIPAGGTARLHARLLAALESVQPQDPAVLTHHAVAAADAPRAAYHARAAAEEAARSGAHTEAVAFLETALAHLPGADPRDRATLLTRLGYEQYMTSRLQPAIATVSATFPLWQGLHDDTGLSLAHDSCAVMEYYNARRGSAQTHAERAAVLAGPTQREFGRARATQAYLAFMRGDVERTLAFASDAGRIAADLGDDALALRSRLVEAAHELALGADGARERLIRVVEEARDHGLDEIASTGYSNLAYLDVEQRRLADAERTLEESLALTVERDIPICNHWQTGVRSRLRLLEGRWRAALEDVDDALTRVGMPVATFWPHVVAGLVHLRRVGTEDHHLEAAWQLAEQLDEPLRRLPALAALAERMWMTGVPDDRVTRTAPRVLGQALESTAQTWSAGDLAVWLHRLGIEAPVDPTTLAEPHKLVLTGRQEEAAAWWHQAGGVVDEALSCVDAPRVESRLRAVEQLDALGATATADRLRRGLRQEGVSQVPVRPRASTRANPSGLTNRQLDVAKLVARGFTNAEIADRLYISPKTTDHHVSAVLTKLGTPNRRAVVVQAHELGLA